MNSETNNELINVVMKKKRTLGRRKIEIKKIKNINSRQVTFSKRRVGLFKKASELCILTGAEVAMIIHSPGNHVFSFGHPNIESLINRYTDTAGVSHNPTSSRVNALLNKHDEMKNELEAEKKRENINNLAKPEFWWNQSIDDLDAMELEACILAAEELKKNVLMKENQMLLKENSAMDDVV